MSSSISTATIHQCATGLWQVMSRGSCMSSQVGRKIRKCGTRKGNHRPKNVIWIDWRRKSSVLCFGIPNASCRYTLPKGGRRDRWILRRMWTFSTHWRRRSRGNIREYCKLESFYSTTTLRHTCCEWLRRKLRIPCGKFSCVRWIHPISHLRTALVQFMHQFNFGNSPFYGGLHQLWFVVCSSNPKLVY